MNKEQAQALLATINSNMDAFSAACKEAAPDNAEEFGNGILDMLAEAAGEETEGEEKDA